MKNRIKKTVKSLVNIHNIVKSVGIITFTIIFYKTFFTSFYIYDEANTYIKENYSNVPDIAYYNVSNRDGFFKYIMVKNKSEYGRNMNFKYIMLKNKSEYDRIMKIAILDAKTRTREYYLENDPIKLIDCKSFGSSPEYYITKDEYVSIDNTYSRVMHTSKNNYSEFNRIFCENLSQEDFKLVENNKKSIDTFITFQTSKIYNIIKIEEQIEELKDEIKYFERKRLKEVALVDGEDYSDIIEAKKEKLEELKNKPEIKTFEEFLNDK